MSSRQLALICSLIVLHHQVQGVGRIFGLLRYEGLAKYHACRYVLARSEFVGVEDVGTALVILYPCRARHSHQCSQLARSSPIALS